MDNDDDDRQLVERFRHGDREAFADLVVRYQRPVYNAAWWVLRSVEDASDVAQSVFLKVAERLDDYDPRYRFFSWIYRIAVNESLNVLRRNGHEEPFDGEVDVPGPDGDDPERRASDAELSARVRNAVMGMATNDRTVLMLRHFSELSYLEIGQILELDEKTVKSRLFEARQRLRGLLGDLHDERR
ncbi:ECF RNA polymerase sigma factor SigW [Burkholderiales bacterium]|nr:ECF RNA polymerase sigma factor SigW [Burkholderiales bacterium]